MSVLRVSNNAWASLSRELSTIPSINKTRISPKRLSKAFREDMAYVVMDEKGKIIVFGALWPTQSEAWVELGTMFVADRFKGQGHASTMFNHLFELVKNLKKSVFLITRDSKVQSIANGADWVCPMNWEDSPCACAIPPSRAMSEGRKLYYFHQTVL